MVGYAIASFFGIVAISAAYGMLYKRLARAISEKINQAWKHRIARFIILVVSAIQAISGVVFFIISCYLLFLAATFTPYLSDLSGYQDGSDTLLYAWLAFAISICISLVCDVFKIILVLTFAD
ncbi:hypothetical protein [Klebsiella aerogenes]|uniref:hypothetical protein n=1 Tax=Klebsiella aerogenes TaxID=548 RepID=UPI000515AF69|nr:hypothetical protein [Klebsiella aerogenes]KZQ58477.1 hypothetical protein A3N61_20175 [Klebsiella aerogenes]HBV9679873.1 hypothetical protein [Klebsiella aerogenes]HBZ8410269.1 hypothetical protein [Klebsiella aerogenes]HCM5456936.1 hypothetical protein [Klebsiella aerogenes]HDU4533890.1 hypothetical protein [Klebsiella aerogenes]